MRVGEGEFAFRACRGPGRPHQPDAIRRRPRGCALRRIGACGKRAAGVKENLPQAPGACLCVARRQAGSGATRSA